MQIAADTKIPQPVPKGLPLPSPGPESAAEARSGFPAAMSAEEIYAEYDFTAITPRQIDELADRLRDNGVYDFGTMMALETRGERFVQHMHDMLYEAGLIDTPEFDATTPMDLIEGFKARIEMSRRHGDPTAFHQRALDRIEELQRLSEARRAEPRSPVATTPVATPALTQSLFGLQTTAA